MLTHEQNEALVRVGPGTPMGKLMRQYWIPFLPSSDLEADGQPVRVRLLGEDLVAFRDTEGRVGLMDHACPHRGAPMALARNEACGLRCPYHGWKFDVAGNVVDTPAEPEGSRLKERVKVTAYPCVERNGMVWTYMGPAADALPPLPNLEWNLVPAENIHLSVRVQECNWLQALEGEIDSAHAPILHGRVDANSTISKWVAGKDLRPSFEVARRPFGVSIAARRRIDEEKDYLRVNQFVMPFYTMVPPQTQYPELSGHAWVPMDDENTLCIMFSYHPSQPLYEKTRKIFESGHNGRETAHASPDAYAPKGAMEPYAKYWTKYNRETAYQLNYEDQRSKWFSGIPGLWPQDAACQSGVAPIYDRTRENLGTTDTGIAVTRRFLLDKIEAVRTANANVADVADPDLFMIRAVSVTVPHGQDWVEACATHIQARLGEGFGYDL